MLKRLTLPMHIMDVAEIIQKATRNFYQRYGAVLEGINARTWNNHDFYLSCNEGNRNGMFNLFPDALGPLFFKASKLGEEFQMRVPDLAFRINTLDSRDQSHLKVKIYNKTLLEKLIYDSPSRDDDLSEFYITTNYTEYPLSYVKKRDTNYYGNVKDLYDAYNEFLTNRLNEIQSRYKKNPAADAIMKLLNNMNWDNNSE